MSFCVGHFCTKEEKRRRESQVVVRRRLSLPFECINNVQFTKAQEARRTNRPTNAWQQKEEEANWDNLKK